VILSQAKHSIVRLMYNHSYHPDIFFWYRD